MDAFSIDLLDALKSAIHGLPSDWTGPHDNDFWKKYYRTGQEQFILPLIVEAVWDSPSLDNSSDFKKILGSRARQLTYYQARRTADFLLLYSFLQDHGLHPVLLKGIICRNLYPVPDQRASFDEDFLIHPEESFQYHEALLDYGFHLVEPTEDIENTFEVAYQNEDLHLYIEVHKKPFEPDSEAYGDLNELFEYALDHTCSMQIGGMNLFTISPTYHLIYLICHAYKHFLHSGVGIRQACDIGLFAQEFTSDIDWTYILESCKKYKIDLFAAAVFSITAKHLGCFMPSVFSEYDVDELPLLDDMLSGGLYGASDLNRTHSSNMTLDAVAADKNGKRTSGWFHSIFLPVGSLKGRYTYLRRYPWLLPVAWVQRIWNYLRDKGTHPAESIRIGRSRVELLRKYGIIK